MSIESYILGLQKNPSPGKIGKIVLGGLELLAGIYEKGVVKKYEKAGRNARRMPIPVISVGNSCSTGIHRLYHVEQSNKNIGEDTLRSATARA